MTQHLHKYSLTRIAPTPSGYLHPGNIYSFFVTSALARKHKLQTLLRIDDADKERYRPEYVKGIFECLEFYNIPIDSGPTSFRDFENGWSQRLRMKIYVQALHILLKTGTLYACNCSRNDIKKRTSAEYDGYCAGKNIPLNVNQIADAGKSGLSWRIKVSNFENIKLNDLHLGTINSSQSIEIHDFIVKKRDGWPSYQLTSLCDDNYFKVNFIVRGQDLLPSTFMQMYLAKIMGYQAFLQNGFCHHPLLMNEHHEKFSKSTGNSKATQKYLPIKELMECWYSAGLPLPDSF